jgi:Flp pilus assembly protein CpaB
MEVTMRRGRIFFYLAFILILGLVALVVIYIRFIQPMTATPDVEMTPPPIVTVNVVTTTQRVPRGDLITERVLNLVPIHEDLMLPVYFTDIAQVVGKRARVDIEPNMFMTSGLIADTIEELTTTGSNAALSIPRGMVAVSIPIDRLSSVSYAPQAGDHVNVIVNLLMVDLDIEFQTILPNLAATVIGPGPTAEEPDPRLTVRIDGTGNVIGRVEPSPFEQPFYSVPSERQRPRLVSQNLIQNAIVLHVGEFELPKPVVAPTPTPETPAVEAAPGDAPVGETPPAPPKPDLITLIVTPQDALTLNYLMAYDKNGLASARLTLALRSSGDDTLVITEATTLDFLLQNYNIPVPVRLPYGIDPSINTLPPRPAEVPAE